MNKNENLQRDREASARVAENLKVTAFKRACGIPAEYKDASLDLPEAAPALCSKVASALRGLAQSPRIIALCGAGVYQVGKTHLSCAAVNLLCNAGRSARYARAMDIFTQIKSTFGAASKRSLIEVDEEFRKYDLLVIDELQVRSGTDWEENLLRAIIDIRSAELRSTILIANLKRETLLDYLGPAISKRINKRGGGAFTCAWPEFSQWTLGKESK